MSGQPSYLGVAVAGWVAALKSSDSLERRLAAHALAEIGRMAPEAVSRIIQGIMAGIGFLGGGAILKDNDERHVRGLTTAASIWLTAAVGVLAGYGSGLSAILTAGLAIGILAGLGWLERAEGIGK